MSYASSAPSPPPKTTNKKKKPKRKHIEEEEDNVPVTPAPAIPPPDDGKPSKKKKKREEQQPPAAQAEEEPAPNSLATAILSAMKEEKLEPKVKMEIREDEAPIPPVESALEEGEVLTEKENTEQMMESGTLSTAVSNNRTSDVLTSAMNKTPATPATEPNNATYVVDANKAYDKVFHTILIKIRNKNILLGHRKSGP